MIYIFLIIYSFFVLVSLLYVLKDPLPSRTDFLVILSASFDRITRKRILKGVKIAKTYPECKVLFCGQKKSCLFQQHIKNISNDCFINAESTNTYEDAFFSKKYLEDVDSIILVTSSAHQRRSKNTFQRVYKNLKIYNSPTNDLFCFYSPFLPSGWIVVMINLIKDWRYNGTCK